MAHSELQLGCCSPERVSIRAQNMLQNKYHTMIAMRGDAHVHGRTTVGHILRMVLILSSSGQKLHRISIQLPVCPVLDMPIGLKIVQGVGLILILITQLQLLSVLTTTVCTMYR